MTEFVVETDIDHITAEDLLQLYNDVGWNGSGYRNEMNVADALKRAEHICFIKDGDKLVAFGRLLSNGFNGYIHDLITHPEYRRKGLATKIMDSLLNFGRSRYPFVRIISAGGYNKFYDQFDLGSPKTEKVYYKVFQK